MTRRPLPGETAEQYHRRLSTLGVLVSPSEPVIELEVKGDDVPIIKHLSNSWKGVIAVGVVISSIFTTGVGLGMKINDVLTKQAAIDLKLTSVLTKKDLAEAEMRVEARVLRRFASREVYANCPVLSVRGQSHKPCPIEGLTDALNKEEER